MTPAQFADRVLFDLLGPDQLASLGLERCPLPWVRAAAIADGSITHHGRQLLPAGKTHRLAHLFTVTRRDPERRALLAAYRADGQWRVQVWPDRVYQPPPQLGAHNIL